MNKKVSCIMLIDDHHPTNVLHTLVIENCSCTDEIIIFDNAEDALKYFKFPFSKMHPKPEIIFLDINMPGMTGWEFLDEYKKLSADKKSDTLLLMLSTSSHPKDLEQAQKEPIVKDYIYKPLTINTMQNVIIKYFNIPETELTEAV